mmetsp:Transcript_7543/g.18603  ORF Transcript_7543/g.18603 Transcript_7543/m.18603 type:complete len:95 (-) Transcript_7543:3976-4260(-)
MQYKTTIRSPQSQSIIQDRRRTDSELTGQASAEKGSLNHTVLFLEDTTQPGIASSKNNNSSITILKQPYAEHCQLSVLLHFFLTYFYYFLLNTQ